MALDSRLERHDVLFYLSLGLYLFICIISESFYYRYMGDTAFKLLLLCCVGLLLVRELRVGMWSMRSLIGGVCCLGMLLLMKKNSSSLAQTAAACIWLYVFAARNVSFEGTARYIAAVCGITVLFVAASARFGLIPNYVRSTNGGRLREYLGFRYALYGPAMLLNIICMELCGRRSRIGWWRLAVLALASVWMFWRTDSRLSFLLGLLMLCVGAALKVWPLLPARLRLLCRVLTWSFVICFVVSLFFTLIYNKENPLLNRLDVLAEYRLSYGSASLARDGVKLLGQKISWTGNGLDLNGQGSYRAYNYVDCLYVQVIQRWGILFTLVFLAAFTAAARRCLRRRQYHLLAALAVFALRGMVDDLSMRMPYNTLWLALGTVLLGTKTERALPTRVRETWELPYSQAMEQDPL